MMAAPMAAVAARLVPSTDSADTNGHSRRESYLRQESGMSAASSGSDGGFDTIDLGNHNYNNTGEGRAPTPSPTTMMALPNRPTAMPSLLREWSYPRDRDDDGAAADATRTSSGTPIAVAVVQECEEEEDTLQQQRQQGQQRQQQQQNPPAGPPLLAMLLHGPHATTSVTTSSTSDTSTNTTSGNSSTPDPLHLLPEHCPVRAAMQTHLDRAIDHHGPVVAKLLTNSMCHLRCSIDTITGVAGVATKEDDVAANDQAGQRNDPAGLDPAPAATAAPATVGPEDGGDNWVLVEDDHLYVAPSSSSSSPSSSSASNNNSSNKRASYHPDEYDDQDDAFEAELMRRHGGGGLGCITGRRGRGGGDGDINGSNSNNNNSNNINPLRRVRKWVKRRRMAAVAASSSVATAATAGEDVNGQGNPAEDDEEGAGQTILFLVGEAATDDDDDHRHHHHHHHQKHQTQKQKQNQGFIPVEYLSDTYDSSGGGGGGGVTGCSVKIISKDKDANNKDINKDSSSSNNNNGLMDILSAALLITGNTVGAGTMVLPNVAAGPGLGMSTALLAGIYCINLVSGLLLAEVAIKQHESSGGDVPSSFKEFAESSLKCSTTANCISSISIFVNWCVLAFALTRAGELASTLLPNLAGLADSGLSLDPTLSAAGVATVLTGLVGTQSNQSLSRVASAAVTVLFASFAGLLLPGLATVHDPIGAFLSPGTICSGDVGCALSTAAPIFLSTMIYQNIVPSVTKLLNYDRQRTTVAITCGSAVPLMVYTAFNLSVLGGGLTTSVSSGGPILTAFVTASLVGSSIAGVMSLSEEFDNVLFNKDGDEAQEEREDGAATASTASLNSVLLAVGPPLLAGSALASGGGATAALDIAGGYCSPLLYGLLPVVMAAKQRNGDRVKSQDGYSDSPQTRNLVPGGMASLGVLGTASTGFILQKLASDVGDVVSSVGLA
mmetsp:Transcript_11425/g.24094  ORF Transcript_11425/g.24094 Transcript_11425/m.24094 type:complete len:949 (+) Transcript_11425:79-2925(+)